MPVTFRSLISELWASFGEAPPQFTDEDAIELAAEDLKIRLEESGDGRHLIVSAEVGPLPADRMRRDEQIRRILSDNLAFITSQRGCGHLQPGGEDPPVLTVGGLHSYDERVGALSQLIDDILFLRQWHAEALRAGAVSQPRFSPQPHERSDVIFRP